MCQSAGMRSFCTAVIIFRTSAIFTVSRSDSNAREVDHKGFARMVAPDDCRFAQWTVRLGHDSRSSPLS